MHASLSSVHAIGTLEPEGQKVSRGQARHELPVPDEIVPVGQGWHASAWLAPRLVEK